MDPHPFVAALKQLALDLGRTPTREEFCTSVKGARTHLAQVKGGFTVLVQQSGLETYDERRARKIDNSIFQRNLETHLENYEPKEAPARGPYPTIAVISDIHWPFENPKVIAAFLDYVGEHQPEWVILNGDAWDFYSSSKYPRSHNVFTPRQEQEMSRTKNEAFWVAVKERSPKSKRVQMLGNHDIRPLKRILESYPEAEDWIEQKLKELFSYEGVTTIFDPREELMIGEIAVFHGYRTQLGAHRDYTLYSCINGHTHRGGVVFRKIRGSVLFEMNSGVAGDPESKGLSYTSHKIQEWTPGFGAVDRYGPRFIAV